MKYIGLDDVVGAASLFEPMTSAHAAESGRMVQRGSTSTPGIVMAMAAGASLMALGLALMVGAPSTAENPTFGKVMARAASAGAGAAASGDFGGSTGRPPSLRFERLTVGTHEYRIDPPLTVSLEYGPEGEVAGEVQDFDILFVAPSFDQLAAEFGAHIAFLMDWCDEDGPQALTPRASQLARDLRSRFSRA